MAFCTRCGKQLEEGAVCECSASTLPRINTAKAQGFWESMKNRMGIGEPERNATDTYERDMKIVPECISANENEIPVKQYNIAVLRNLIRFERAEGRLQVTNKRVVFRAAGRSIGGRTTLQQEFAIDELAGIEAQRNYRFGFIYLLFGIIIVGVMTMLSAGIFGSIDSALAERRFASRQNDLIKIETKYQQDSDKIRQRYSEDPSRMQTELDKLLTKYQNDQKKIQNRSRNSSFYGFVKVVIGLAGLIPFFLWRKKWLLKLAILSISYAAFMPAISSNAFDAFMYGYGGRGITSLFGFNVLTFLTLIIVIIGLALYSLKPNLVLLIKTKGGVDGAAPIKIQRSRGFWMWQQDGGTGFAEVFPTVESESAIREVNAIIGDLQKLGDFGLEKWKL